MADAKNAAPAVPLGASGSGWQVVWGVLLIVAGILAVLMPGVAALATALIFAWLLIFGGAFEIVYAIQSANQGRLRLEARLRRADAGARHRDPCRSDRGSRVAGADGRCVSARRRRHSNDAGVPAETALRMGLDIVRRAVVDRRRDIDRHRLAAELAGLHRAADRIFTDRDGRLADRAS